MSLIAGGRPKAAPPCAVCGGPAPEGWQVWEVGMCGACVGAWNAAAPAAGQLAAEVGWDSLAPAYLARTKAWAEARRAKLALQPRPFGREAV